MYHVACLLELFHLLHDSMVSTIIFNIVSENMGDLLSIRLCTISKCALQDLVELRIQPK
jgi:hypothetical protein